MDFSNFGEGTAMTPDNIANTTIPTVALHADTFKVH